MFPLHSFRSSAYSSLLRFYKPLACRNFPLPNLFLLQSRSLLSPSAGGLEPNREPTPSRQHAVILAPEWPSSSRILLDLCWRRPLRSQSLAWASRLLPLYFSHISLRYSTIQNTPLSCFFVTKNKISPPAQSPLSAGSILLFGYISHSHSLFSAAWTSPVLYFSVHLSTTRNIECGKPLWYPSSFKTTWDQPDPRNFFLISVNCKWMLMSTWSQLTSGALSNYTWTHLVKTPTTLMSTRTLVTLPTLSQTETVLMCSRTYYPTASSTLLADSATYTSNSVSLKMHLSP